MKRLATILLGLMLTSCSIGYYDSGVLLATTANISVQPAWGPAGYDCAHYYYFPDYNFYYDVNRALFYYHHGNRWLSARQLPYQLGYPRDLYKFYKVVLNIRDPWNYNRRHISEYRHFKGMHNQPVLRDRYPNRYPHNNHRPPQVTPQPKPQVKPQARPQGSGNRYNGQSSPNTIRNSRNNNTSRNNVATPPSSTGRGNSKLQQSQQRPSTQGQGSRSNVGTQKRTNSSSVNTSRSNSSTTSKSSESKTTTNRTNSTSGSRSTGSRGR